MVSGTQHTGRIDRRSAEPGSSPATASARLRTRGSMNAKLPGACADAAGFLTRAELASHLKVSVRSVDRFVSRHHLRTGPARPVLVRVERYAWRLASLRRQSTRSTAPAPAVQRGAPRPCAIGPGEELVLVARSNGFDVERALRGVAPRCPVRTPDQCPPGHWLWSFVEANEAMAGVLKAMARGAPRPTPEGDLAAARYLRQLLRKAHTHGGQPFDAPTLARTLRQLPAGERHLVLEALAGEVVDAARASARAPLEYAREPLLTESDVANEVRRTIATVRRWRVEGTGPVFLRIERAVRYSRVDLDAWMAERLVR